MKKEKKIEEKIKNHLYMILNLAGVEESVADKIVPIGTERIMEDVVRETFERFIEETRIERIKSSGNESWSESGYRKGWNEASDELNQNQAKWLKDNQNKLMKKQNKTIKEEKLKKLLQQFIIKEIEAEKKKCPICGKVVDESWRGYDGNAECPACIENGRYEEFDNWRVANNFYFKWDDIGYNRAIEDIKQKLTKWLKENLLL